MKAIVKPQSLRDFARFLMDANRDVGNLAASAEASFVQLGQAWQDAKYANFGKEFTKAIQFLERFRTAAEKYSQFLQNKARLAERYLERR